MDIKSTMQFVKNCRGLHLDNKMFIKMFFVLPLMLSLVLFNGWQYGNIFRIVSLLLSLVVLVLDIWYSFLLSKKALKYKLLFRPIIILNIVVPLFYISCLIFYGTFGLKNFLLYYFLPSFVWTIPAVLVNFLLISGKIKSKSKAKVSFIGCALGGTAVIVSRKMNDVMSAILSEDAHFLIIAFLVLILNCFMFLVTFADAMRFYYYIKLEKLGLVTEDILKPKE